MSEGVSVGSFKDKLLNLLPKKDYAVATARNDLKNAIAQTGNIGLERLIVNAEGKTLNRNSYLAVMGSIVYEGYQFNLRKGRADRGLKVKIDKEEKALSSTMFDVVLGLTDSQTPPTNPTPTAIENIRRSKEMAAKITDGLQIPRIFNNTDGASIVSIQRANAIGRIIYEDFLQGVQTPNAEKRLSSEVKGQLV